MLQPLDSRKRIPKEITIAMQLWILNLMIYFTCQCNALEKVWQKDTLFNNAANWQEGRIPCAGDKLKMPEQFDTPVYVQNDVMMEELVLPVTGDIFMDSTVSITLRSTGRDKRKCGSAGAGELIFNRTNRNSWYDPESWTADPFSVSPVPHTDRIPCSHDHAQFLSTRPIFAVVDGPTVFVKSISFGDQTFSNEELNEFLESDAGKIQMQKKTEITVTGASCRLPSGCPCGNDVRNVIDAVCSIQNPRCVAADCENPIKPTGHCCEICGGLLEADYRLNFTQGQLNETIWPILSQHPTIDYYVSHTTMGKLQIIITDSENDNDRISKVSNKLFAILNQDTAQLGIIGPQLRVSSAANPSTTGAGNNVAVEVVVILVVLCIIYAAYYIVKKKQWSLKDMQEMMPSIPARGIPRHVLNRFQGSDAYFRFARRLSSITSLSSGMQEMRRRWTSGTRGSHQMDEGLETSISQSLAESADAFANPMYSAEVPEEDTVPSAVLVDTEEPTRENPTYDLVDDMNMTVIDGPSDDIPQFDQSLPTRETGSNVCLLGESMESVETEVAPEKPPRQRLEELVSLDPPPLEDPQDGDDLSSSESPATHPSETLDEATDPQDHDAPLFPASDLFD